MENNPSTAREGFRWNPRLSIYDNRISNDGKYGIFVDLDEGEAAEDAHLRSHRRSLRMQWILLGVILLNCLLTAARLWT